ncbi:MAG: nitrous oxide-stimulated promoter family protein [Epsilonproteobacteria bacterium]|nr:nitrous oxide-stimulated promoter family protein [Campylobacterota bacterium]
MTEEKFKSEVETLKKFFQIYCEDKHQNQKTREFHITYKNLELDFSVNLCDECNNMLNYSISKLQECPNDPKPRCRKCENPCYEKDKYKQMAKMMRHSGMKLGLTKAAKRLKSIFKPS